MRSLSCVLGTLFVLVLSGQGDQALASAPAPEAMIDLVGAKGLADGAVYLDHLHFHKHTGKLKRPQWGQRRKDADGMVFRELLGIQAKLRLFTDGGEQWAVLVVRRLYSNTTLLLYWNGKLVGKVPLERQGWQAVAVPIVPLAKATQPDELRVMVRRQGSRNTQITVSSHASLLMASATLVAGKRPSLADALSVARMKTGELKLMPGQRLSYYFPLPPHTRLQISQLSGGSLNVRLATAGQKSQLLLSSTKARENVDLAIPYQRGGISRLTFDAIGSTSPVVLTWPRLDAPRGRYQFKALKKKPTNVIVYVIDSLRWDKFRIHNPKSRVQTPNLDAFFKRSVVFTNAYVQGNWSKSTAASLFTSMWPSLHQGHLAKSKLPKGVKLPQQLFKRAGFHTIGLIANGYVSERQGYHRGFDKYYNYITMKGPSRGERIFRETMAWLDKKGDKPFFLYLQTVDPHLPYRPPMKYRKLYFDFSKRPRPSLNPNNTGSVADWLQKSKKTLSPRNWEYYNALYDGEITYTDHHFGLFIAYLKKRKLLENTVIVVTSDHGEEFRDHNSVGHGHTLYDELLHVPLVIFAPGLVPEGRVVTTTTEVIDVMPTVLEMAGLRPYDKHRGKSLLPLLRGPEPLMPLAAFCAMGSLASAIMIGRYKLIRYYAWGGKDMIFDLKSDPKEQHDLSKTRPILMRYLDRYLEFWGGAHQIWSKRVHGRIGDHRTKSESQIRSAR